MKGNNINTKEIFERDYKDRNWNWYRGLLAECIKYGIPGKWLDLGAGLGLFVECAQKFGIDCIGLEGSEYAVNKAKERFPNIDITQHFLEDKLPFKDNSISTIMCHQIIEHISNETAVFMLKECHRILVVGGVILIYSPSKYNRKQRLDETHINLYSPSSLKIELENVGFKILTTPNDPRSILGTSRIAKYITKVIYRLFPFDYLSATANCIAIKLK
jgi:ubiquinone/menaquinone biosynthesis C-methylase UbiE